MATLERKPKPSAVLPASPTVPPISASPVSPAAAVAPKSPGVPSVSGSSVLADDLTAIDAEKLLVEFLRRPESLAAVRAVNPKIADAALAAAVVYVTNRAEGASWVGVATSHPQSVLSAVVKLAASGLVVSHVTGEAFLVPRYDKILKTNIATPIPGVRGLEKKIFESGKIASVDGNIVRAQDHFEASEGLNPTLVFRRNLRPDASKANPVIGAYVVIVSSENRPPKIKTTAIEERIVGEGALTKKFWSVSGKDLNTGRMNLDSAAVYTVQRPAMREVIRTWLHDNTELNKLVEMEDFSLKTGEEIIGAQPRIKAGSQRTNQPSVVASNVAVASSVQPITPANGHNNGTKADPVTAAVENAKLAVPAAPEENLQAAMKRAGGLRLL